METQVGSTTGDFGPDLHVFLQVGQRLQVLLGTSRHHFLQLDVHLAQAFFVQPGQRRKNKGARHQTIHPTVVVIIILGKQLISCMWMNMEILIS